MTERKFTDEQIIKALECCSQPYCNNNNCPLNEHTINTKDCITKLSTNSLDLINRQRAEIERLHSEVKEKTETIVFLKDQATGWSIDFCNLKAKLNTAKAEAIKEFAERVKEIKVKYALPLLGLQTKTEIENYVDDILLQMRDGIDRLAKEMTEGIENELS